MNSTASGKSPRRRRLRPTRHHPLRDQSELRRKYLLKLSEKGATLSKYPFRTVSLGTWVNKASAGALDQGRWHHAHRWQELIRSELKWVRREVRKWRTTCCR